MVLINTVTIYIFSFVVSLIIFLDLIGKFDRDSVQDKLYILMLCINAFVILCEMMYVIFNKVPGKIYIYINSISNVFVFAGTTYLEALWILYNDYQVYHQEARLKKYICPFAVVLGIYTVMAALSPMTGWLFFVDQANVYTRGNIYFLHMLINFSMVVYAVAFLVINRKKVKPSYFWTLLLFIVPPVVLAVMQVMFFGLELIWSGITISMLIVYFNIQNHTMNVDYLTGAYNRKMWDNHIRDKVAEATENKTFSMIVLDLNDFKLKNDTFGHQVGDFVLKETVKLLESVLKHNDFIARLGGDEFVIVLNNGAEDELNKTVHRIEAAVQEYNRGHKKPFHISFCMGYAVYDSRRKLSVAEFFKYVDGLMYENKRKLKASTELS